MAEEKKDKLFEDAIKSIKDKFNEIKDSLNKDSFDNIKNDVVAKLEDVKRELEYNEKLDSVKTKMKDNVFLTVAISLAEIGINKTVGRRFSYFNLARTRGFIYLFIWSHPLN